MTTATPMQRRRFLLLLIPMLAALGAGPVHAAQVAGGSIGAVAQPPAAAASRPGKAGDRVPASAPGTPRRDHSRAASAGG